MVEAYINFKVIKGIQAGMEYYVAMVPLSLLPKLFVFSQEELPPEIRAQRILNKARIPEMRNYILQNPNSYVFSALTTSIDGDIKFEPISSDPELSIFGRLSVPLSARFLINDGQHRKAAIEAAMKENPRLKNEDISIVMYYDNGLKRSQQIFSDLNRHAIRPTKSLNILYNNRDEFSQLLCKISDEMKMFSGFVEKERASISNRSKALFTLSGLYHGSTAFLQDQPDLDGEEVKQLLISFWETVYENIPEWQDVVNGIMRASDLRRKSVCAHSIALIALGTAGNRLIRKQRELDHDLRNLCKIDWNKSNPLWQGNVVIGNNITGTRSSTAFLVEEISKVLEADSWNQNGQI
jgi:DNA sulfur modification protein DndB